MVESMIEVDDAAAESIGDGYSEIETTASLTDSARRYRTENGRTYHAYHEGAYHYPNDQVENDRLDLQHHLWALTLKGKLGLSPPNQAGDFSGRVLDVGTGTGIWAVDFADEHPASTIIGVDLSPTQPTFTPPNVFFQIEDVEDDWTFAAPFDYIHSRAMNGSFTDWPAFMKTCFGNLQPGGWLEIQEFGLGTSDDGSMGPETALGQACQILHEGGEKLGHAFVELSSLTSLVREAGFIKVHDEQFLWPSNTWPKDSQLKELAIVNNANVKAGMEGFILGLGTRGFGLTREEVADLASRCRDELDQKSIHAYWPITVVYAQKPEV